MEVTLKPSWVAAVYFLLIGIFTTIIVMGFASAAEYISHQQNTDFDLIVSSDNATLCNLSYIQYPNGDTVIVNTPMTKDFKTFYLVINAQNYTSLGDVCHGITCTDGLTFESGSICRNITTSGDSFSNSLALQIIALILVYSIALIGFFGKNKYIALLGGLGMLGLGVFVISNGLADTRGFMVNILGYITLGLGAIIALTAGVESIEDM
jgi:hypothetical protein